MNKGGFSWKRATGITRAKQKISRATGIPMTKSGRQRKVGKMVTGGGCILNTILAIIIILLIILSFSLFSCGNQIATVTTSIENATVEYKLATLNAGSPIKEDDITVYQFKKLLDELEKKTINTRIDIADIAVAAQKLLKEHGISRTLLQILDDFNTAIPDELTDIKLEEIASVYMVLMTK